MKTFVHRGGHVGALWKTFGGVVYATYYLEKDIGAVVTANFVVIEWKHYMLAIEGSKA